MKIIKFIISVLFISLFTLTFSFAEDCSKYDKLSKEYAKCTSNKLKKEASQKADEIKSKTVKKIEKGKKKFNNSKLKDSLMKFKNSKNHKEFIEKMKNDN
tara:strand:- start:170 stop:469 length:300 start_codon:yes stop_codon:yes gene_type:complete